MVFAPYPAGADSSAFGAQFDGVGLGSDVSPSEVIGPGSDEVGTSEVPGSSVVGGGSLAPVGSVSGDGSPALLVEPLDVGLEVGVDAGLEDGGAGVWVDVAGAFDVPLLEVVVGSGVFDVPGDVFVTPDVIVGGVVTSGSGSDAPQPMAHKASRFKDVRSSGRQATELERKPMSLDAPDARLDHGFHTRTPFASHGRIRESTDAARGDGR